MRVRRVLAALAVTAALAGAAVGAYFTRDAWRPWLEKFNPAAAKPADADNKKEEAHAEHAERVKLSPQARANLKLDVDAILPEPYPRTVQIPGIVVDRPGLSDRGVTVPVSGVVTHIGARPGNTVRPGEPLFTIRIVSESLQTTQAELFKATRDLQLNREQIERIRPLVPKTESMQTLIDLESQERRLKAVVQSFRQELANRGLTPAQADRAAKGEFVTDVTVATPGRPPEAKDLVDTRSTSTDPSPKDKSDLAYEVKELKVQLGDQVQAGQQLAVLANHHALYVEGRGFPQDSPLLERAAQEGWKVEAEFAEEVANAWPPLGQELKIQHLANSVDPTSRTFGFFIPLENQSRAYSNGGQTFLVWRFRPGQRVRLKVPVEQFEDVFVLPAAAVVREGAEAYVFRQNGDFFERKPVRVLHEDRTAVVIANDGSVGAGEFVARNGASALNRALKAQAEGGGGHGHSHEH